MRYVLLLSAAACADAHRGAGAQPGDDTAAPEPAAAAGSTDRTGGTRPAGSPYPAPATAGEPPAAEASERAPAPERDPRPLYVLEGKDAASLQIMRGDEPIADLPPFASGDGSGRAGSTRLVANAEYALLHHVTHRPGYYLPDPEPIDPAMQPQNSSVQRMMLVRRSDQRVLWRRGGGWLAEAYVPFLAADGRVVIGTRPYESLERNLLVIERDGGTRTVEGVLPLSAPDADGWVAIEEGHGGGVHYGFLQLDSGERVAMREPLQGTAARGPYYFSTPTALPDGTLEYLSLRDGELALVHERHDQLDRVPLGRSPLGGGRIWPAQGGWLISAADVEGHERPWLWVDRAGRVRAIEQPQLDGKLLASDEASGEWFAFRGPQLNATAGWLNAATSQWKPMPEAPTGLQPFATEYCWGPPNVLVDGRALVGLRDERFGAVYREDGAGGFERISLPIRDSVYAEVTRVGETLQVHAVARQYTYCPEPQWRELQPAELPAVARYLRGGQSELIRGERSVVVEQHAGSSLDPSGRHAAVYTQSATVLHDLELGTQTALPDDSRVAGWLP